MASRRAAIMARAPLPPEDVARIGAALADAIHSVHLQDVIHFDIKPENFLLRPTGEGGAARFRLCASRPLSGSSCRGEATRRGLGSLRVSGTIAARSAAILAAISSRSASSSTNLPPARSPLVNPRLPPACAIGCGASQLRHARSIRACRPGCRRSSSAAWNPRQARATNQLRTSLSTCAIPEQVGLSKRASDTGRYVSHDTGREVVARTKSRRGARRRQDRARSIACP